MNRALGNGRDPIPRGAVQLERRRHPAADPRRGQRPRAAEASRTASKTTATGSLPERQIVGPAYAQLLGLRAERLHLRLGVSIVSVDLTNELVSREFVPQTLAWQSIDQARRLSPGQLASKGHVLR